MEDVIFCRAHHESLFAGSNTGYERTAAMHTLIGAAKQEDREPEAYLRHVLGRIADHLINRLDDLLPRSVDLGAAVGPSAAN